jgi:hypothetical protein
MTDRKCTEFEEAATKQTQTGLLSEVWGFLRDNRKWWLFPVLALLVLLGALAVLSGTGFAPFIYPLF